jgi:hypothetical protein
MTFDASAFVQDLAAKGKLPNHSYREYSKPINLYLGYQSTHGQFLEPFFDHIVTEIEKQEERNRRSANVKQRFVASVRTLILNAMHVRALIGSNLFLSISLNRNDYGLNKRYAPNTIAYKPFRQAYDGLLKAGYLEIHRKGFHDPDGFNDPVQTQINATDKLIGAFESFVSGKAFSYARQRSIEDETIILRNEDRRKQEYKDDDFTNHARDNLARINAVLAEHEFRLPLSGNDTQKLQRAIINHHLDDPEAQPFIDFNAVRLYRIFNDGRFDRGGRFYRGWWQNIPKNFRSRITIDEKKVAELDYSTLHPSILYAEQGMALDFDAYDILPKVKRDISKRAFNALLNAKRTPDKPDNFDEDFTGIKWKDFLDLIQDKHKILKDDGKFLKGYGLHIQFQDSELAESILLHFADQGIPCLPIHDSFIVSEDKAEELYEIMKSKYERIFNQHIDIKRIY